MIQHRAYKFRIYPNKEQSSLIIKTIGSSRFIFNYFLDMWNKQYKETGKGMTYSACSAMLPRMKRKEETIWLKEVDSIALQTSLKDLADSFSRFFKKQNKYPNFKSKNNPVQSYRTNNVNHSIQLVSNKIKLPKLGLVKISKSHEPTDRIINATVRKTVSDKYFVSLLTEEEICELPKTHSSMGIDLGVSDFAIFSDGSRFENNRFTSRMEKKLKREQRKLSRRALIAKQNGKPLFEAKNYQKQKIKVARLHEKVANQREDFLNKLSTEIVKNHDLICIEDLNVKGMLKNKKLSKSISDVSWASFVSKLTYKASWYGRQLIKIDRWFPSSQLCSTCGHNDEKKPLSVRAWTCSSCATTHDRDINASINILNEGMRLLQTSL